MPFLSKFYIDVGKIHVTHKCIVTSAHKCSYPRGRGSYGFVFCIEGQARFKFFDGESIDVSKGEMIFLSSDAAYVIVTQRDFLHYTVNFDIHTGNSSVGVLKNVRALLVNQNTEVFENSMRQLVDIWTAKKRGYEMRAVSVLYRLLTDFYFDFADKDSLLEPSGILVAKEYIERFFNTEITLEKLAYLSNMSITNFRREWGKRYSETPMQYRDSIRVYYAREYLNSGYYSVSEVAKKCGFDDVSYFIRFFKKKTGVTPGASQKI